MRVSDERLKELEYIHGEDMAIGDVIDDLRDARAERDAAQADARNHRSEVERLDVVIADLRRSKNNVAARYGSLAHEFDLSDTRRQELQAERDRLREALELLQETQSP